VAWSDGTPLARVELRVDGADWHATELAPARGRFALTRWRTDWHAEPGWHTLEARATDASGRLQPLAPEPNAGGYANNAVHRVAVEVEP
jgi:hypothetical protein